MKLEKNFMNEMLYLAGMNQVLEEAEVEQVADEITGEELEEAVVSINQKLKDAEASFLGNIGLITRQYLKKQYGIKVNVVRTPAMGGKGSIGGSRIEGPGWQIDIVVYRKGNKWELWKRGTMAGIEAVSIEDKVKNLTDVDPETVAMAVSALYGGLLEKSGMDKIGGTD